MLAPWTLLSGLVIIPQLITFEGKHTAFTLPIWPSLLCVNISLFTLDWYQVGSVNSLVPGRTRCHFKTAIFNLALLIGIFTSSEDNALTWMPRDLTDDKSILVQVMAWCRQATSHYLSQSWPSPMSPYGVTRPQWVNFLVPGRSCSHFQSVISEHMSQIKFVSNCEIALGGMRQNTFDDKSILFQVMAWWCQRTQCSEPMLTKIYVAVWWH